MVMFMFIFEELELIFEKVSEFFFKIIVLMMMKIQQQVIEMFVELVVKNIDINELSNKKKGK